MLARTREGHEILAFIPCDEPVVPSEDAHIPLTFTLVAAHYQGQYVMIFEPVRNQWEIPGGGIEIGENPLDCARRELFEESAQVAEALSFKGLFQLRLHDTGKVEYGALYATTLTELRPFIPNEEAERMILWKPGDHLVEHISILSTTLIDLC